MKLRPHCRVLYFALCLPLLPLTASTTQTIMGESSARLCFDYATHGTASPRRAIETCTRAINDESLTTRDLAATYSNRGIIQAARGRFELAIEDYDRSLQLNPTLVHAMINRANARTRLRQFKEALDDYDLASFYSEGRNGLVFYNRAMLFMQMGRVENARADLLRALELQPESLRYREALASLK